MLLGHMTAVVASCRANLIDQAAELLFNCLIATKFAQIKPIITFVILGTDRGFIWSVPTPNATNIMIRVISAIKVFYTIQRNVCLLPLKLLHNISLNKVLIIGFACPYFTNCLIDFVICSCQGGSVSILTACESPRDVAGVVLISPMVQMNPESATPFKVGLTLQTALDFSTRLSIVLFSSLLPN